RIVVLGVGPDGALAGVVPHDTRLLVAGARHLEVHAPDGIPTMRIPGDLEGALDAIDAIDGTVCVIGSGDPGWFGIVRALTARFVDVALEIHPAPSSVAGAFASIGLPWDDAVIVSAHGRDSRAAIAAALTHAKVAVMTAPSATPAAIAGALLAAGCAPRRVVVAVRLGHDDQVIHDTDLAGAATLEVAEPNVLLLLDPARTGTAPRSVVGHTSVARPWARPVADYEHRDGQCSKPAVRALTLAHLGPGPGRLLWDVGCGSGSVAVEAAGLGAGVVAIDRDAEQLDRTRANAVTHGVGLGLVLGEGPAAFDGLPDPDAVFVGGGGASLPAMLEILTVRCRDRLVVALATIERLAPTLAQLRGAGWQTSAQVVEVHDLVPLGDGHRLAPQNPIVLVLAERP
ncbi:MAG: precorrin-6y C5,15-methyltransferase (decarboxylating) subunit CbiE, partial [Nitriliruptor sp.]|uniref:precorrin-6y C5,15-methyltransferase (decarboxylating) subunit CbiE n=1 Tax=Nitriliruptor sp. TaxID=2448056 RepID=UPI0034A05941